MGSYYPSALQASSATPLDLAAGQEMRGMDFVPRPISTAFIRGRVIKPAGAENCAASLEGEADGPGAVGFSMFGASARSIVVMAGNRQELGDDFFDAISPGYSKLDKDGKFEFRNIPVGTHSLSAFCGVGKQQYSVKTAIQLDAQGASLAGGAGWRFGQPWPTGGHGGWRSRRERSFHFSRTVAEAVSNTSRAPTGSISEIHHLE